uniref:Putative ovule protein n=1 Tax=Solanum chacoense TaxID=4108 RepID=A0A0V0GSC3_SOLCH
MMLINIFLQDKAKMFSSEATQLRLSWFPCTSKRTNVVPSYRNEILIAQFALLWEQINVSMMLTNY